MNRTDRAGRRLGHLGLLAVAGTAGGTAAAQDGQPETPAVEAYKAELHPVNNSGVSGIAMMVPSDDGTQWTVIVAARNLETGQEHPQHIHGLENGGAATCPTLAADTDGDNLLTLEESTTATGPALLPLEPFPTSDDGTVTYGQMLDASAAGLDPLTNRVVELHGMTVPGQGYVDTMPVACGEIVPALPQRAGEPADDQAEDPDADDADTDDAATDGAEE